MKGIRWVALAIIIPANSIAYGLRVSVSIDGESMMYAATIPTLTTAGEE